MRERVQIDCEMENNEFQCDELVVRNQIDHIHSNDQSKAKKIYSMNRQMDKEMISIGIVWIDGMIHIIRSNYLFLLPIDDELNVDNILVDHHACVINNL
jgi:hypothetical protein